MKQLTLNQIEEDLLRRRHRQEFVAEQLEVSSRSLKRMQRAERDRSKAIIVLEYIIERDYDEVIDMFEETVGNGLRELFDEQYGFRIELDRTNINTTCEFQIATSKCPVYQNLRMTQGKSVQEIIAAIMRIVICWLDKDIRNIILMDECFGGLRDHRKAKAAEFLQKICKDFSMQIVLVTQFQEMLDHADNGLDLTKKKRKLIC